MSGVTVDKAYVIETIENVTVDTLCVIIMTIENASVDKSYVRMPIGNITVYVVRHTAYGRTIT